MKISKRRKPGKSYPVGATVYADGINFSLFSQNASAVELLLFDKEDHTSPTHTIRLDPKKNKSFYYWHIFIEGLEHGQLYGFRVYGPYNPRAGHRFDGSKVLVDPYARAVVMDTYDRRSASTPGNNCAKAIKSVAIDPKAYDWEGDQPLDYKLSESVIYELHVAGFTRNPNSGVTPDLRGTYRGLIEKIPYLQKLGITHVELMPVQQYDPYDLPNEKLQNYWGYSPIAFFAPHTGYCHSSDPVEQVNEFRDMVKAFHRAGIGVILDVVFNHTAEGNHDGPTLSFKGLENVGYYLLDQDDLSQYYNYSGTGNTLMANHSIVRRLIRWCLRHWVSEMHVDGFRFDLAAVLSRDEYGIPVENPPILWSIESDPVLANTLLMAEAWDLGAYQLGSFTGDKWAEWNGRFRDDVRRFLKGDNGMLRDFTYRLSGSQDIMPAIFERNPNRSINFITCHDGFTLNDLVTYNHKYNHANGEDNRDGSNSNYSWNCGVEGETSDPDIDKLRSRQIRNFLVLLMISQGTPMLSMGDEVRRSQKGNNNAYCQDNELSWMDWDLIEKETDLLEFTRELIKLNLNEPYFQESSNWNLPSYINPTEFKLYGVEGAEVNWGYHAHAIAFSLYNPFYERSYFVMINAWWNELEFCLPEEIRTSWHVLIDTAAEPPDDYLGFDTSQSLQSEKFILLPRSILILWRNNEKVLRYPHRNS